MPHPAQKRQKRREEHEKVRDEIYQRHGLATDPRLELSFESLIA
jgi:hypothetical protein